MTALPNPSGPVVSMTAEILRQGCRAAAGSPRHRIILPLHRRQDDPVQRMINFLQPGTYVRPHVHPDAGQIEFVQVLQGRIGFLLFQEDGEIASLHDLAAGPLGLIDIEAGVWHTLICLLPDTVIAEAKLGPYDPLRDKSFASWAPGEADAEAATALLRRYESLFPVPASL